jgi:PhnB protein
MKSKRTVKKRSVAKKTTGSKKRSIATPMLAVHDGVGALEFYNKAFGAKEVSQRIPWEGKIGHVEFEIEGARLMLADEFPDFNRSPRTLGGTPVSIHIDVADVDALFDKAVEAGAKVLQQIKDEPYGRICKLEDPFGHTWFFNTVSPPSATLKKSDRNRSKN